MENQEQKYLKKQNFWEKCLKNTFLISTESWPLASCFWDILEMSHHRNSASTMNSFPFFLIIYSWSTPTWWRGKCDRRDDQLVSCLIVATSLSSIQIFYWIWKNAMTQMFMMHSGSIINSTWKRETYLGQKNRTLISCTLANVIFIIVVFEFRPTVAVVCSVKS